MVFHGVFFHSAVMADSCKLKLRSKCVGRRLETCGDLTAIHILKKLKITVFFFFFLHPNLCFNG